MLDEDVRFVGFSTEDWRRLIYVFQPHATPVDEPGRARGGVVVVHDGARVRKLLSTRNGRLPLPADFPSLEALATDERASWAISLELGALDDIMERFGERLRPEHDLWDQALLLVGIFRELLGEAGQRGTRIETWPRRLRGVPVPNKAMIDRALETIVGQGQSMGIALFKDGEIFTSLTLRRKGSVFDLVMGPEEIRPFTGLLSGDFHRDVPYVVRAMEDRSSELAFGCFAEVETFRQLLIDTSPGAWGRAAAIRDIVLSPMPTAVRLGLGVDGARFAFEQARQMVRRYDSTGMIRATGKLGWNRMFSKVEGFLSSREGEIEETLGFDPLEFMRLLIRR